VRTDVPREDDWLQVVQITVAQFGKLDILVHNAGLSSTSVVDPMDAEEWRRRGMHEQGQDFREEPVDDWGGQRPRPGPAAAEVPRRR